MGSFYIPNKIFISDKTTVIYLSFNNETNIDESALDCTDGGRRACRRATKKAPVCVGTELIYLARAVARCSDACGGKVARGVALSPTLCR